MFASCNETAENHFPVCSSGTEIGTQTENSAPSGTRTRPAPDRRVPAHPGAPRRVPARGLGGGRGARSHGAAPGAPPALTISRLCRGKQRVVRKLLTEEWRGDGGKLPTPLRCPGGAAFSHHRPGSSERPHFPDGTTYFPSGDAPAACPQPSRTCGLAVPRLGRGEQRCSVPNPPGSAAQPRAARSRQRRMEGCGLRAAGTAPRPGGAAPRSSCAAVSVPRGTI